LRDHDDDGVVLFAASAPNPFSPAWPSVLGGAPPLSMRIGMSVPDVRICVSERQTPPASPDA